jgi:uncharacterized membrane protein
MFFWNLGYAMCHQLPARSFFYGGYQMPVCARDMGIYLGFLVVFLYWVARKRSGRGDMPDWIVLGAVVVGVLAFAFDALSSYLGFRDTTNDLRLASGLMMGVTIGVLLLSVISAMNGERKRGRAFAWTDLPLIYLAVLLVGLALASLDVGAGMYYFLESVTMIGLLFLLMTAFLVLFSALTLKKLRDRREAPRIFIFAGITTTVLLVVLWFLHDIILTPLLS